MKKLLVFLFSVILLVSIGLMYYKNGIKAVGGNKSVTFTVEKGDTYSSLGSKLKSSGLIKSEFIYKVYIKTKKYDSLKLAKYELNTNMDLDEILTLLSKGNGYNPDVIKVTFKEGINIREIDSIVEEKLGIKSSDCTSTVNDKEYIRELINKYWFLTDDILNSKIYYPLEGYLFPSTYEFYKNSTSKDVVTKMLNEMDKLLSNYKTDIEKSSYSIHEIMTLASIVELEGKNDSDRDLVASVFNNRVKGNWSLGSDVTTYYYLKIDDFKTSLNGNKDLYTCDYAYNTRCTSFKGLPVGPICSSGKVSITSSINIKDSSYYYFVADCKGKVYFNTNSSGHYNTINKLKADGNWCS